MGRGWLSAYTCNTRDETTLYVLLILTRNWMEGWDMMISYRYHERREIYTWVME
jgi:hypothetical protein